MKKQWAMYVVIVLSTLTLFGLGCSMEAVPYEGSLIIQLQNATRNIFESSNDMTGEMDIKGYRITLTPMGGTPLVYDREATSSSFVFEALTPGSWRLTIAGFNDWDQNASSVTGNQIAYLRSPDELSSVEGEIDFSIQRGRVTAINNVAAVLVPVRSSTGDLDIVVNWSALDQTDGAKLYSNPDVTVTITQINDKFGNYPTRQWNVSTTETKSSLSVSGTSSTLSFDTLPVGWYEVIATLTSTSVENDGVTQLKRMGYVRVIDLEDANTVTTTGTFTISDTTSFATGSLDLTISEDMDPLEVGFTTIGSPESIHYSDDRGFNALDAVGFFEVTTEGADEAHDLSYRWYVNGEVVEGQSTSSILYGFEEAGQYTITAVVYEKNGEFAVNWGSTSHEVIVSNTISENDFLTVSVTDDNTSFTAITSNKSDDSNTLQYLWFSEEGLIESATTDTYTPTGGTSGTTVLVFVCELDTNGTCVRWGSHMRIEFS